MHNTLAIWTNPSQEGYYNRNNPLVEGVPPHIQRPSPARWRLVNMWGHPFYQGIISVVTWVPPHIHRPRIFRCLRPGPHLFPCSSMHWTTVFCIDMDIKWTWPRFILRGGGRKEEKVGPLIRLALQGCAQLHIGTWYEPDGQDMNRHKSPYSEEEGGRRRRRKTGT